MATEIEDLGHVFDSKAPELIDALRGWYKEETASLDGSVIAEAPSGTGGSIIGTGTAMDSKRVVDATVITKKILEIELPPEIIRPGGYDSFDDLIADIVPKLKKVFIGETKVRPRKTSETLEAV